MVHSLQKALAAAWVAFSCLATSAQAQVWPDKPVKVIVPVAAGGPSDTVARVVAQKLSERLGQPVIVDNRPGGGANIGTEFVSRAPPDGYTLLLGSTTQAINATLYKSLGYDFVRDFAPVSRLTTGPLVLVVNPRLPVNSVNELIALSRTRSLNFASSNVGASTHLASEMLKSRSNMNAAHVPYKGSGPALTDTMGGQVDFMFDTMLSAMPFVTAGKLKALAVTSDQRAPTAPNLPTMIESGQPGFEATAWNGLLAPAKTPPAVIARLNAELQKVLADPEVKDKFAAQGFAVAGQSPQDFSAFIKTEIAKWAEVVRSSKASAD